MAPLPPLSDWAMLALWHPLVAVAGLLLYRLRNSRPPGRGRLWLALPLVSPLFAVPCLQGSTGLGPGANLHSFLSACLLSSTVLLSLRVAGWAMDRGPLAQPLRPLRFITVMLQPILPLSAEKGDSKAVPAAAAPDAAERKGGSSSSRPLQQGSAVWAPPCLSLCALWSYAQRAALAALAGLVLINAPAGLPRLATSLLHAPADELLCVLHALCTLEASAVLAHSLLGLPCLPPFINPYASTTFAEFWSQRWNLTVSTTLRFAVYDPLCEGCWVSKVSKGPRPLRPPSHARRSLALCASFLVSGLWHELLLWHAYGTVTCHHLAFFSLMGPLILLEAAWRRWLHARGLHLPPWLAQLAINAAVLLLADRLYWEPFYRHGSLAVGLALAARLNSWRLLHRSKG